MKSNPAHARLERKLARDPATILSATEVRFLTRELRRALADSFPTLPAEALDRSEKVIRWSALGERCKEARGGRGIRDMLIITGIPQYRLRAIETGRLSEIRPDFARRYFRCLGIEDWLAQWCQANRGLARRAGLFDRPGVPPRANVAPVGSASPCVSRDAVVTEPANSRERLSQQRRRYPEPFGDQALQHWS